MLQHISLALRLSKADSCLLGKEFGTAPTCKWRPWSYAERVNVAEKVAKFHRRKRQGGGGQLPSPKFWKSMEIRANAR